MLGELAAHLIKNKKYKKDVEKLVDAHVTNRLNDEARFVRARAAWTLKQYSGAQYNNRKILKKAVDNLIKTLCNDQEELPGCVESALALQCMLEDQEKGFISRSLIQYIYFSSSWHDSTSYSRNYTESAIPGSSFPNRRCSCCYGRSYGAVYGRRYSNCRRYN